jgi:hypothetical protein
MLGPCSSAQQPAPIDIDGRAGYKDAQHRRAPPQVGALAYDTSERDIHGDR